MILTETCVSGKSLLVWIELFKQQLMSVNEQFDPGHRIDHVKRVAETAVKLAIEEKAKLEVIVPAIWLHDCVPISKFSPERAESSKISAKFALNWLVEHGYPQEYLNDIQHAIEAHSFSGKIKPTTLEAMIVQDADRLDALGAIGIARTMIVGGRAGNPLYDEKEPFPNNRQPNDSKNMLDHFFVKLLKLKDSLCTVSGKREGLMRTEFMFTYLQQLGHEIGIESAVPPLKIPSPSF